MELNTQTLITDSKAKALEAWSWAENMFLEERGWLAISVIIVAFIIGYLGRSFIKPKLEALIDKRQNLNARVRQALTNLTRLVLQTIALLITFTASMFIDPETYALSEKILSGTAKLLLAWIFIRTIAQFIENNFVRQTVATIAWAMAALSILGVLDSTSEAMDAIGLTFGEFRLSLLTVFKTLLALSVLLTLSMFSTKLVEKRINKSTSLTPSVKVLLVKVVKITLIALAVIIGITSAGLDLSALAVFGGALGLGIGFGLQKVVSNLFSGVLLLLDRSIKPGDIIELENGTFGWVGQLGSRYVSVVTRDNKEYLIPNEDFITQRVINWSYSDRLIRIEMKFGVHYDSDPHLVKKIAQDVALKPSRVVSSPAPVCHLVEFGDSSLNFSLRFWIEDAEEGVTNMKGAVMLELWEAFKEHNIQIPYPHRELILPEGQSLIVQETRPKPTSKKVKK
jgi:small-conductance mechanosensitive channel